MTSTKKEIESMAEAPQPRIASTAEVVAMLSALIFEMTADGYFLAFHGGEEEDLYLSPDKFVGEHFSESLPGAITAKIQKAFDELDKGEASTTIEYFLPSHDPKVEELQYFECQLVAMESGNRLAIVRNMTEAWRARMVLQKEEERFRHLVQNIPGAVYRTRIDVNWTAVFFSSRIVDLCGYPAEDFVSGRRHFGSVIHPEDRVRIEEEVAAAVKNRSFFDLSYRIIDADGDIRQIHERGQGVYGEDDEPRFIDGVMFDVTDIHQMRQRVLTNHRMAAVGNLAAGVAHEINNPLAIIMANLEYVSEELDVVVRAIGDDPPIVDALDDVGRAISKVQSGTDRVRRIIDDLRTFSDTAESRADQIELRRIVTWAIQRFESRLEGSAPSISTNIETVPAIWASEVGVVQVIWNLLDNAFDAVRHKASGEALVEVTLRSQGDHVLLEIADNGEGMEAEVANRAFEPFFTTKAVGQGAGLGLFVCQGLLKGMDGTISFDTRVGEGTRVQVCFPVLDRI